MFYKDIEKELNPLGLIAQKVCSECKGSNRSPSSPHSTLTRPISFLLFNKSILVVLPETCGSQQAPLGSAVVAFNNYSRTADMSQARAAQPLLSILPCKN